MELMISNRILNVINKQERMRSECINKRTSSGKWN